jgi:hypothetical protein
MTFELGHGLAWALPAQTSIETIKKLVKVFMTSLLQSLTAAFALVKVVRLSN